MYAFLYFVHFYFLLLFSFQSECIVIPRAANVYIQPVSSNFIRNWNDLMDINAVPGHPIKIPKKFSTCSGASILHDLQLNMLDEDLFIKLSNYAKAYRLWFVYVCHL